MSALLLFLSAQASTATISDMSLLEDTVISGLLMDERVRVFSGEDVYSGVYQGFTGEFIALNLGTKPVWFKQKDVDSLEVFLPLHERITYTKKDRFLVSLAGGAFTEISVLAMTAAMSKELKDKLALPLVVLSPFLGFALAQTAVGSPERHPSPTKTRLLLMMVASPGMEEPILAPGTEK